MIPTSASLVSDYATDGVVCVPGFLSASEVKEVRRALNRYISNDLPALPPDARTFEKDDRTVRNLWRLEKYSPFFKDLGERADILAFVAPLLNGQPVLCAVETFNKPARVGSGVPYHQDNAYFCQSPPDMLTVWIAIDAVTQANGPVFFVKGSHKGGMLPTMPSGVRGNSIGMAVPSEVPLSEQFCGLLAPGDATIHHCETVHHSAPNTTEHSRLGLLLVYRGSHTETDHSLKTAYSAAVSATPPS